MIRKKISFPTLGALLFALGLAVSCTTDIKNLENPTAQKAALELAESYLTDGQCDAALEVLQPLLVWPYLSYESRLLEASAYACRGGVNFPAMISSIKDGGSDLWSALVKANYSTGTDGKENSLFVAIDRVCKTGIPSTSTSAVDRTEDANTYMIFVAANQISTIIAPLGAASRSTGKRTQALNCAANCTDDQRCKVEIAFAHISDSINHSPSGSAISKVGDAVTSACSVAVGGICPTNKDYDTCMGSAALKAQGEALVSTIEASWSL